MAWSYIQGASGHTVTSSITLTLGSPSNAGDILIATFASYNTAPGTVTVQDSVLGLGSYSPLIQILQNSVNVEIWYFVVPTNSTRAVVFNMYAYIGCVLDNFRCTGSVSTDGTSSSSGSSTGPSAGTVGVTGLDLVYATAGMGALFGTPSAGPGFTISQQIPFSSGNNMGIVTEYALDVSSPVNPGLSLGTSAAWAMTGASHKTAPPLLVGNLVPHL